MASIPFLRASRSRGQVALETAFVFSMLLFLTFAIVNLAILFHTKMIATYSAFMAARSFQVFGDQSGATSVQEYGDSSSGAGKKVTLLSDLGKTLAPYRVAEDIFTCALPWIQVPDGDSLAQLSPQQIAKDPALRCQAGKRRYKNLNTEVQFAPFEKDIKNLFGDIKLTPLKAGYAEKGREGLRYGILSVGYKSPILFYVPEFTNGDTDRKVEDEVFVPVLLNPGLSATLKKVDPNQKGKSNDP